MALLKAPITVIEDPATFRTGWGVLLLPLVGFFVLDPSRIPVSTIAAPGMGILFAITRRERVINTDKVLRGAPWQVMTFSLGMYPVVYDLRSARLTGYPTTVLSMPAERGLRVAALGIGILSVLLSSIMNNMFSILVGALSIDGSAAIGTIKEAMIYANVIGYDLEPKITPIGSLATLPWLHVPAQKYIIIGQGYYFRCGTTMTLPVLLMTLATLALRLSLNQPQERTISITTYRDPDYDTSHNTLVLIRNSGTEPTIIYYLETSPSRDELRRPIAAMAIPARAPLRKSIEPYNALRLAENRFTDDQLIDFMLQHPIPINRPITAAPRGTRLCCPSEVVLETLTASQKGVFVKGDGEPVIDTTGQRVK